MKTDIIQYTKKFEFNRAAVKRAIDSFASHFGICPRYDMAVYMVGPDRMRSLNFEHMGKDRPTDVLSFPLNEPGEIVRGPGRYSKEPMPLGDVFLCPEHILSVNCAGAASLLQRETLYLLLHGFMHLIGYDHEEDSFEGSKMHRDAERFMKKNSDADHCVIRRGSPWRR